jgi:hypothetical protein
MERVARCHTPLYEPLKVLITVLLINYEPLKVLITVLLIKRNSILLSKALGKERLPHVPQNKAPARQWRASCTDKIKHGLIVT